MTQTNFIAVPKISIILPTYNGEKWIISAIESVIKQTEKEWELIIVDDCSTDKTGDIVDKYAEQDHRIKVIHNLTNKKLPASLNIGFSHAQAKYWTWTSDDNLLKDNFLSVLSSYLDEHPDVDLVAADQDMINENGQVYNLFSNLAGERNPIVLAYKNNINAAFLYRKSIADKVGVYDENMFCAEDYDYWCRVALSGNIKYIKDNIYQYRTNQYSLSATKRTQVVEKTAALQHKYKEQFIKKYNLGWLYRQRINYHIKDKGQKGFFFYFFKCYVFLVKIVLSLLFFWHVPLRRKLRNLLCG